MRHKILERQKPATTLEPCLQTTIAIARLTHRTIVFGLKEPLTPERRLSANSCRCWTRCRQRFSCFKGGGGRRPRTVRRCAPKREPTARMRKRVGATSPLRETPANDVPMAACHNARRCQVRATCAKTPLWGHPTMWRCNIAISACNCHKSGHRMERYSNMGRTAADQRHGRRREVPRNRL